MKRHAVLTTSMLGLVAVLTACGGGSDAAAPVITPTSLPTVTAVAPSPVQTFGQPVESPVVVPDSPVVSTPAQPVADTHVDGDWEIVSLKTDNDAGDFAGTARIKYSGSTVTEDFTYFTVTLFKGNGETVLATLKGSVDEVQPGRTVTVDLFGSDKYRSGSYRYELEKTCC